MTEITVLMCVYNAEKYLDQSIKSILDQTYKTFEFLIINDCSTDNTPLIIKKYAEIDSRITVINNSQNLGLTASLNIGIKKSIGKFIARMDADDISDPERLEKQYNFFCSNPQIDILGTNTIEIDNNNNILNNKRYPENDCAIKRKLLKYNTISHPSVMFKKSKIVENGYYDEKYRTSQDYELWLRLLNRNVTFHNLQENLLYYRVDNNFYKRKKFRYRVIDLKIRLNYYKLYKVNLLSYIYLIIPITLMFVPDFIYGLLKKFDPRNLR